MSQIETAEEFASKVNIELCHKQHYDALCGIMQCIESYEPIETVNDELDKVNLHVFPTENGRFVIDFSLYFFLSSARQRVQLRRPNGAHARMQTENNAPVDFTR